MTFNKLIIVTAPGHTVEFVHEQTVYAPKDYMYIVPDKTNFLQIAKVASSFERERNDWIRAYDNVLNGLKYWKSKALQMETDDET